MNIPDFKLELETPADAFAVEQLAADAFGPGRFARSAFRLREDRDSDPELSFVAVKVNGTERHLVGSIKLTAIRIEQEATLLLGPLIVTPSLKNSGIGAALMTKAVNTARDRGHQFIVLVGDEPYYRKFGFIQVPRGQIALPGPADPSRILCCELVKGCMANFSGTATKF